MEIIFEVHQFQDPILGYKTSEPCSRCLVSWHQIRKCLCRCLLHRFCLCGYLVLHRAYAGLRSPKSCVHMLTPHPYKGPFLDMNARVWNVATSVPFTDMHHEQLRDRKSDAHVELQSEASIFHRQSEGWSDKMNCWNPISCIYLFIYLSLCLSICLSIFLSIYFFISIYSHMCNTCTYVLTYVCKIEKINLNIYIYTDIETYHLGFDVY